MYYAASSPNQRLISACQKSQQRTTGFQKFDTPRKRIHQNNSFLFRIFVNLRSNRVTGTFCRDVCASSVQDKQFDEIHRSKCKDSKTCSPIILNLLQSKTPFLKHNLCASMYHVARAEAFCRSSRKFTIRNHSLPRNSP